MLRSTLLVLTGAMLASTASGKDLTAYRAPNALEQAYTGVAADLKLPEMCERISPQALLRVRKPALARSRCYYYVAINAKDLRWCDKVVPIPVSAGLMNWLDPERCRFQADRIIRFNRTFPFAFEPRVLLTEMGYREESIPDRFKTPKGSDWRAYYRSISRDADGQIAADFRERLESLPSFGHVDRATDQVRYFTEEQKERELDWVMNRAMRLCVQGRISADCRERFAELRKNPAATKMGGRLGTKPSAKDQDSGLREATPAERAYYDAALLMNEPRLCERIGPEVVGVGWSVDPGFLVIPIRSACLSAVAVKTKKASLCDRVAPLARSDIEGDGLTSEYCRRTIEGLAPPVHRRTLRPAWTAVLKDIGYTDEDVWKAVGDRDSERERWLTLVDQMVKSKADAKDFVARLLAHEESDSEAGLVLTEAKLRRHLYQLQLIRFHCSINRNGDRYLYQGYELKPPAKFGGPFELVDQHGRTVTDETFRGRYLLVFFGFTHCPHVCPMNMMTITRAMERIGDLAAHVQPVFVSVDPKRDTPERIKAYLSAFSPNFVGLTGSEEQIRRAAKAYNAYYFAGEVDGSYVVDHTAWTYLVGPDGRSITYFDHGTRSSEMAEKISAILERRRRSGGAASAAASSEAAGFPFGWPVVAFVALLVAVLAGLRRRREVASEA